MEEHPKSYSELFDNPFINSDDLGDEIKCAKIKTVMKSIVKDNQGNEKMKGILVFENAKKQMVLNRTNGECIKAMFGTKITNWIGKRIYIYAADKKYVQFGTEKAIRIWGSPDIEKGITAEVKLPKRKPEKFIMHTSDKR